MSYPRLLAAIKLLESDLARCFQKAEEQQRDPKTREIGQLRMDLVNECRRYLFFAKLRARKPVDRLG